MNCQELQDYYELFALGAAEEPERTEIRAHLNRNCEVCVPGVQRVLETAAMLGATAPDAVPSRKLRERILASVGVEPRRFSWSPVWAVVAAASLALLLYVGNRQQREKNELYRERAQLLQSLRSANIETARLNEAFAIVNGAETKEASFGGARPTPPRGKVFLNPAQGVLLMAFNLPQTPVGKLYEMWVVPKTGKPVAAGMFQSQPDGSAMHVRPGQVDIQSTGAVAVTVEDQVGADQPTTQPLIVAALDSAPR